MDDNILYNRLISENLDKGFQVRLVINEFKDVIYLQLRKYFLSYEGEWLPSREGVSIPASFENVTNLLEGLLEICAKAEGENLIVEYYNKISQEK